MAAILSKGRWVKSELYCMIVIVGSNIYDKAFSFCCMQYIAILEPIVYLLSVTGIIIINRPFLYWERDIGMIFLCWISKGLYDIPQEISYPYNNRYDFYPVAFQAEGVLSLPAAARRLRLSVRPSVNFNCPHNNSSQIWAGITKFAPDMYPVIFFPIGIEMGVIAFGHDLQSHFGHFGSEF